LEQDKKVKLEALEIKRDKRGEKNKRDEGGNHGEGGRRIASGGFMTKWSSTKKGKRERFSKKSNAHN